MSGSAVAAHQQVKLGELKMAQERIDQRINSAIAAVNEQEKLKLETVRRAVEESLGLEKATKHVETLKEKVSEKIKDLTAKHNADIANIESKYQEELSKANSKFSKQEMDVKAELQAETVKLAELKEKVTKKIGDDGASIKQQAANIRLNLNSEKNRLNDKIYATVLPPNLREVVDEAPKIGQEKEFANLQFSGKAGDKKS
jgi:hypothetical protein